jgi:hypothetical protein
VPDDIRELDPVGRSLMREERRAALETQKPGQELEAGDYPEFPAEFDDQQQPYGNGQQGYQEQPTGFTGQPAYEEQQQTSYDEPRQPSYDEQYFAPNGTAGQNDTFADSFPSNGGYPEPGYAEPVQEEHASAHSAAPETFSGFEEPSYRDDWPQQDGYRNGYPDQYAPEAESTQAADVSERDHVGFERPGPAPSAVHALTDAGLPRRGSAANGSNGSQPASSPSAPESSKVDIFGTASANGSTGTTDWQSANDERWQQASALKKPKAGGVTSSGLPRRVPKANLVEGTAESTPQGGPQVSRAPEDIRGRLSNLRRGVQRGRSEGSETNGQGFGSDSTYNQER